MKTISKKSYHKLTAAVKKMLFIDEEDFYEQDEDMHIVVIIDGKAIKVKAWCPVDRYICSNEDAIKAEVKDYILALRINEIEQLKLE